MSLIDNVLEKLGLKFDDLTTAERETLFSWEKSLQSSELTVADVRRYVRQLHEAVDQELAKVGYGSREDTFLKARLRNYTLLEAFLTSPEKAREAISRTVQGIMNRKGGEKA